MSVDEGKSVVDVDRLILLVKPYPALYDSSCKEHHNADLIARLWRSIGRELNVPERVCKARWYNLRNSYVRYLRNLATQSEQSKNKIKKWHLADSMAFLEPYTRARGRKSSYIQYEDLDAASYASVSSTPLQGEELQDRDPFEQQTEEETVDVHHTEFFPASVADVLKSAIESRREEEKQEHHMLTFFRSLIPDIELLSRRGQRTLKASVLETLNKLLEQEEDAEMTSSSRFSDLSNASNHGAATNNP